jgi:integrase
MQRRQPRQDVVNESDPRPRDVFLADIAPRPDVAPDTRTNDRLRGFASPLLRPQQVPAELRPVVRFAYITGWRIPSEVLPLEWRRVDFKAGEVRLDANTTKNGDGRVFPMTTDLRRLLQEQHDKHEALKDAGHIEPWVFFRMS